MNPGGKERAGRCGGWNFTIATVVSQQRRSGGGVNEEEKVCRSIGRRSDGRAGVRARRRPSHLPSATARQAGRKATALKGESEGGKGGKDREAKTAGKTVNCRARNLGKDRQGD